MGVIYFVLMVGGLIFFHELGHFLVARLMGVHVVEFSIGFGPKIWSFNGRKKHPELPPTEYVIAALPFGGFVRMYGNEQGGEAPTAGKDVAFDNKPVWRRFFIMLAGPAFNLILPFIIFFSSGLLTAELNPATAGQVDFGAPAWEAGMRPGDRIVELDGEEVRYFWQVQNLVGDRGGDTLPIAIGRDDEVIRSEITIEAFEHEVIPGVLTVNKGRIGVGLERVLPIVGVEAGSAAAQQGMANWDAILSVDGVEERNVHLVLKRIAAAADRPVTLRVAAFNKDMKKFEFADNAIRTVVLPPAPDHPDRGIHSSECVVHDVEADTPAAAAGLQAGDLIASLDGNRCYSWEFAKRYLQIHRDDVVQLEVGRGGTRFTLPMRHIEVASPHELNPDATEKKTGIKTLYAEERPDMVPNDDRMSYAAYETVTATGGSMLKTLAVLGGLFSGKVNLKEGLGGPVLIGQLAAKTSDYGADYFFRLMAFLSISLGLINLLPIPILDGGAILFLAIEGIRRKPVSMRVRMIATYAGLAFIVLLMVIVLRNDLERCWSSGMLGGMW